VGHISKHGPNLGSTSWPPLVASENKVSNRKKSNDEMRANKYWADIVDEDSSSEGIALTLSEQPVLNYSSSTSDIAATISFPVAVSAEAPAQSCLSAKAPAYVPLQVEDNFSPMRESTPSVGAWEALATQQSSTIALFIKHIENPTLSTHWLMQSAPCPSGSLVDVPSGDNLIASVVDALYEEVFSAIGKLHASINLLSSQIRTLELRLQTALPEVGNNADLMATQLKAWTQNMIPVCSSVMENTLTRYDATIQERFITASPPVAPSGKEIDYLEQIFNEFQVKQVLESPDPVLVYPPRAVTVVPTSWLRPTTRSYGVDGDSSSETEEDIMTDGQLAEMYFMAGLGFYEEAMSECLDLSTPKSPHPSLPGKEPSVATQAPSALS
jgi:hypothetical protein